MSDNKTAFLGLHINGPLNSEATATSSGAYALAWQSDVNFELLDAAVENLAAGAGSAVSVNGGSVSKPNFKDSATVTFQVSGSDVTATAAASNPMTTLGDMIYENATPAPARLGGNTTTTKMYLSQTGNGVISAVPAWAQVAYADLSGTPQLPVTIAAVAHNFLTSYTSTTGVFTAAQPAVADLSDTPAANFVLAGPTSGAAATATFRALVAADIPAPVSGTILWSALGNAGADLSLSNAGYKTTFNQTSAVNWTWANTTAATATAAGAPSPLLNLSGTYFTLGASASDVWSIQNVMSTPHLSATVTNMLEGTGGNVTLTITGGNFVVGDVVTFTGLTKATWLNGQNATLTVASATSLTFADPVAGHNPTTTGAETGQVTQANPQTTLTFSHSGTAGVAQVLVPSLKATTTIQFGDGLESAPSLFITSSPLTGLCKVVADSTTSLGFASGGLAYAALLQGGAGFKITSILKFTSGSCATVASDSGISRLGAASLAVGNGTAGDFTGSLKLTTLTLQGVIGTYNGTATVSAGVPSEIVTVDLTAQTAAIGATNITASAPATGMYRISWSATITTADGVSSILGGTNGFQVGYTSPTDSVAKLTVPGNSVTSAANTTGTSVGGCEVVYAKTGTAITYRYDYTSGTPGTMTFELHLKLERL